MATYERLYLVHLQSGDTASAQFNPTEFKEAIEVIWRKIERPGESHEPMEYDHTRNIRTEFELGFDGTSAQGIKFGGDLQSHLAFPKVSRYVEGDKPLLVRRWLMACTLPMAGGQSTRGSAPSNILVVWPGFYSLSMKLDKVEFTHRQWERTDGPPILFTAALKFEADNDTRLFYEDVLADGTERHDASTGTQP